MRIGTNVGIQTDGPGHKQRVGTHVAPLITAAAEAEPPDRGGQRRSLTGTTATDRILNVGSAFVHLPVRVHCSADQGITTIFLPGEDACASHACVASSSG
jgi:hypothetical protein